MQSYSLLYSFSLTEKSARISIKDLSNGLHESVITLPITLLQINVNQRQPFDTYHKAQNPITENQLGTQAMGHEISVISGHHYPHVAVTEFPSNYVAGNIQTLSLGKKGKLPTLGSLAWM